MSRALPIGAGAGTAGVVLTLILGTLWFLNAAVRPRVDPALFARIMPAVALYPAALVLFPISAALFAWLWRTALAQKWRLRPAVGYPIMVGALVSSATLTLVAVRFVFSTPLRTRVTGENATLWKLAAGGVVAVHVIAVIGAIPLILALRRLTFRVNDA